MYKIDVHGRLHRDHLEGPAFIYGNGIEKYYKHGNLHRPHEHGPAVIRPRFRKHCRENVSNTEIIWPNGYFEYYENGKLHRPAELGPVMIMNTGEHKYFEYGIERSLKEFQAIYKIQRWFRFQRFLNKFCQLFEKVIGLPANHDSALGKLYPNGGDLYKETYRNLQNLL